MSSKRELSTSWKISISDLMSTALWSPTLIQKSTFCKTKLRRTSWMRARTKRRRLAAKIKRKSCRKKLRRRMKRLSDWHLKTVLTVSRDKLSSIKRRKSKGSKTRFAWHVRE